MNKQQVIEKIGKENWGEFVEFMFGQTVRKKSDGTIDYFEEDVENFLYKLRTGKLLFFD